jgi:hypothetical protein
MLCRETEKAICIRPDGQTEDFWVPKSQVHNCDQLLAEASPGDRDYYPWEIKEWLVSNKDIPFTEYLDTTTGEIEDAERLQELDFNDDAPF